MTAEREQWAMPEWMQQYRFLLWTDAADPRGLERIEELVNDLRAYPDDPHATAVRAGTRAQVNLLETLHQRGLLRAPAPVGETGGNRSWLVYCDEDDQVMTDAASAREAVAIWGEQNGFEDGQTVEAWDTSLVQRFEVVQTNEDDDDRDDFEPEFEIRQVAGPRSAPAPSVGETRGGELPQNPTPIQWASAPVADRIRDAIHNPIGHAMGGTLGDLVEAAVIGMAEAGLVARLDLADKADTHHRGLEEFETETMDWLHDYAMKLDPVAVESDAEPRDVVQVALDAALAASSPPSEDGGPEAGLPEEVRSALHSGAMVPQDAEVFDLISAPKAAGGVTFFVGGGPDPRCERCGGTGELKVLPATIGAGPQAQSIAACSCRWRSATPLVPASPSSTDGDGRSEAARMLAEFEGHPNSRPTSLSLELALHREEHAELQRELELGEDALDRAHLARELADVTYLAYRSAHVHGIDLDAALREIHRAAMNKIEANVRRGDGKIMKPPGFVPPDMTAAVRELPAGGTGACRTCGGRGWHTAGGNDPSACSCPAGEAWAAGESAEPGELSEDHEPIREVPAEVRRAWEPRPSGYTAEQAAADRAARLSAEPGEGARS